MSQLKRNVIAASLAAAGMFAIAAPSIAAPVESAPQEIKVKATIGSYMDWKRVDGVDWTEAMQLTFVNKKIPSTSPHGYFQPLELDTLVKPAKSGEAVRFTLKNNLTLTDGTTTVSHFIIKLGGVELSATPKVVVAKNESGVVGVGKKLLVTQEASQIATALTDGKYVGHASIVMEGDA
ncbi:CS1 type fimbrial major subunit [Photobacterium kagoshimensis]|uniref:CS1 type fimbrial major subunit n=1 Tax=Photobacterium kagoshimensis TaxID=2910242 RepID=UPI003D146466